MPRKTEKWECEICSLTYDTELGAMNCENNHKHYSTHEWRNVQLKLKNGNTYYGLLSHVSDTNWKFCVNYERLI